jgi:hypothetical protein
LGIFFFGLGIIFVGGGVPLGEITYEYNGYIYGLSDWVIPGIISFLLAAICLAWSIAE